MALLAAAGVLFAITTSVSAQIPVDPSTMKVEGVVNNQRITTKVPRFEWVFPGSGTQTNWQIEVAADPNFHLPLWFWESGTSDKGALGGQQAANYGTPREPTGNPSGNLLPVDSRPHLIYWRLRVQENNNSSWTSAPFSSGVFKMNQLPIPPAAVTAAADGTSGSVPGRSFAPVNGSARQLYCSPSGSDSNNGSIGSPWRTINKGVRSMQPGDTLNLRAGSYRENVEIRPSQGAQSGNATNPITIRSYPGETAIIDGPAAGSQPFAAIKFTGSPSRVSNWIVEDVVLKGSSLQAGVYINNAEYITLRRLRFDPGFNSGAIGVQLVGGGEGNRILNSSFDKEMYDHIEVGGSRAVEIRNNLFTSFNRHSSIQVHNSAGEASIISDNVFRDGAPGSGVIILYLSADGAVVRNNVIHDVSNSGGFGVAIEVLRSGKVLIENNTIARTYGGVGLGQHTKFTTIRNNIFVNTNVAIDFEGARKSPAYQFSAAEGTSITNNLIYTTNRALNLAYPGDAAVLTISGNCPAVLDANPSSDPACDPDFVNSAGDDFRLSSGSPAIDFSDPALNLPVPVGGAAPRDAGAFEFGASGAPPYQYSPVVTLGDSTPRFTWSLVDPDNLLNANNPAMYPDTDIQGAFEVQVDTVQTFDSVSGNRPLFSSGRISSATQGYTIPDANALPPGDYYVRIRQSDNRQFAMGSYSHNGYRIRISSEPQSPIVNQQSPAPGALGVASSATISAHVLDFGDGVDETTIQMDIGINDPSTPMAVAVQKAQVGPTPQEFIVSYQPPGGTFSSGDVIYVRVQASDLYTTPNSVSETWSFTIADSTPPAAPAGFMVVP